MQFNVITLFPEIYDALDHGLIKKAQINKLIEVIAVSDDESTYLKGILRNENLL